MKELIFVATGLALAVNCFPLESVGVAGKSNNHGGNAAVTGAKSQRYSGGGYAGPSQYVGPHNYAR